MPTEKQHEYYVHIVDPINVRKDLLESAKTIISLLRDGEKLNEIRSEKGNLLNKFDKTIREIHSLTSKLKSELPKAPLVKKPAEVKAKSGKKEVIEEGDSRSDLEKLEDELNAVEKQLGDLE